MQAGRYVRESMWTESIAVGGRQFVEKAKEQLGGKAIGRKVSETDSSHQLREMRAPYGINLEHENAPLRFQNAYKWI